MRDCRRDLAAGPGERANAEPKSRPLAQHDSLIMLADTRPAAGDCVACGRLLRM